MKGDLYKPRKKRLAPATVITLSFLALIFCGALLFTLPFMTRDGEGLPFLTALFTATSSVCVTGLTLIDPVVTLTAPGQILLCLLIETGGLSMVTFVSFFMFTMHKKSSLRSVRLAQEYTNMFEFSEVKSMVKLVVITAFICQLAGACVFATRFIPKYGAKGIWVSVFTAISAYCNAGFDLFGIEQEFGSLVNYNGDPVIMYTVMALIVTGGIGFFVFYDVLYCIRNRKEGNAKLSFHTRIVLTFTAILLAFGFVSFFIFEYSNPNTIADMPLDEKLTASLFQSVTARTAGFASVDIAGMRPLTKVIMMLLMFIGAGSGSTGGGVKITTFSVIVLSIKSVLKGNDETTAFSYRLDHKTVTKSMTIVFLGFSVVFLVSCFLFADCPEANPVNVFFEAVSAFATVGLTAGITAQCSPVGLVALITAMFIGRVGPVGFVLTLSSKRRESNDTVMPEGKIMVG